MKFTFLRLITFISIIFQISYFIYVLPVLLYLNFFDYSVSYPNQLLISILITVFIYVYLQTKVTFLPLKIFIYFGMATGFYGLILTGIFSIFHIFTLDVYAKELVPMLLFSILVYGALNARKIKMRSIGITTNKVTQSQRFVFISDVHLGSQSISHLKRILRLIKQSNVDALLIGGDLIDSSSFDLDQLELLNEVTIPIYFVTGNHEYYLKDFDHKIRKLSDFNIRNIDFKTLLINEIQLVGLGDNVSLAKKQAYLATLEENDTFTILMVHQPSLWPTVADKCDLMLSGHTHSGQMFPFHYLVRIQFPYYYGLHKKNGAFAYISSGSGCWGPKIRLGSHNEIVLISIDAE